LAPAPAPKPGVGSFQASAQKRHICLVMSFIIAVCWRCISAVQKPRACPAALLMALSHMLMNGLVIIVVQIC
jgi:hypothetical protein